MPEIVTTASSDKVLYCSFCGKDKKYVQKLIAGPKVFICDECVVLCLDLIAADEKVQLPEHAALQARKRRQAYALRSTITAMGEVIDGLMEDARERFRPFRELEETWSECQKAVSEPNDDEPGSDSGSPDDTSILPSGG